MSTEQLMVLKRKVYNECCKIIDDKIKVLQQVLSDLKSSASNETKSTAGDKHETALAMLQIEQKNTGVQLEDKLIQKSVLDKINPAVTPVQVTTGALLKTTKGYIFVSVALGRITVDNTPVIVLSPQSPLGNKLIGLKHGDSTSFNGVSYVVEAIA